MKIAYLVFAYQNPRLIEKTIGCLSSADASFFVHIDGKRDITPFVHLQAPNVFFTDERVPVFWAEFSGIDAILRLIRQALSGPQRYDYFVLLSGSDYPLRSKEYIHRFLAEHHGEEFITMSKMPAPGKPLSRINTIRFPSSRPVLRFVYRLLAKAGLAQRDYKKYLGDWEPYSGLTWWALTREACQHVLEVSDNDQALRAFFTNTFAPEEMFFHTILGNSPFKSRVRRNLLYEDWSARGARPEMINEAHLSFLESQEQVSVQDLHGPGELLFARKFSDDTLELTTRIDEMVRQKDRLPPRRHSPEQDG